MEKQHIMRHGRRSAKQVTGSKERWTSFLTTSARLYKYPYNEQLMIQAQRADPTACAEYDLWNDKMHRCISSVAQKASHLSTMTVTDLVFAMCLMFQTPAHEEKFRPVQLWTMEDDYRQPVQDALAKAYGISAEHGLETQIDEVAKVLATEYWNEHGSSSSTSLMILTRVMISSTSR